MCGQQPTLLAFLSFCPPHGVNLTCQAPRCPSVRFFEMLWHAMAEGVRVRDVRGVKEMRPSSVHRAFRGKSMCQVLGKCRRPLTTLLHTCVVHFHHVSTCLECESCAMPAVSSAVGETAKIEKQELKRERQGSST